MGILFVIISFAMMVMLFIKAYRLLLITVALLILVGWLVERDYAIVNVFVNKILKPFWKHLLIPIFAIGLIVLAITLK